MRVFLAIVLLVATAIGLAAIWLETGRERIAAETRLARDAREAGLLLDGTLGTYRNIATGLAASPLLDLNGNLAPFDAHVRSLAHVVNTAIFVIGAAPEFRQLLNTRIPLADLPGFAAGRPPSQGLRETLERVLATGQPQLSDLLIGRITGHLATAFVAPVQRDGRTTGFVVVSCDLRGLGALLKKLPGISGDRDFWIADGTGTILFRTGTQAVTRREQIPSWLTAQTAHRGAGHIVGPGPDGVLSRYAFARPSSAPRWLVLTREPVRATWDTIKASLGYILAIIVLTAASATLIVLHYRKEQQEAQRALERLALARTRRQRLNEGLPIIVFHVRLTGDLQPGYRYLSGDVSLVTGRPASELQNEDDWAAYMPGGPLPRRGLYETALRDGSAQHEFDFRCADGRIARMLIHFRRLEVFDSGGGELVGYIQNISETRQAMMRTVHAARLASLGEMSAALAHELRQPLAIMSFAAENALDDIAEADSESARARLQRIIEQSQRAGIIIDHLRAFARGDIPDHPLEPVDIRDAIESALTLLSGTIRHAGADIRIELDNAVTIVRGHQVSVEQVFVNLFMNSLDAMTARAPDLPRWIRVSEAPSQDPSIVCYNVADSGGGIPGELLPRIFEPFVTTKTDGHGTGLGLSLCHGIMQGFGGSIRAGNSENGAVFTLCFARADSQPGD